MKKVVKGLILMLSCLLVLACSAGNICVLDEVAAPSSPVEVFFSTGAPQTRSSVAEDGCSVAWEAGDCVSLWAVDSSGEWAFQSEPFKVMAIDDGRAWFSATLPSPMKEAAYTYYAISPEPISHEWTSVRVGLPDVQDGRASGGADIMVATGVQGSALGPLPDPEDHSSMSISFKHLVHLLRLYMPNGTDRFDGEAVEKIVLTMPRNVVGTVSADLSDPSSASLSDGSSTITLDLSEPIHESGDIRDFAMACIFPVRFGAGDKMTAKLYTDTKVGVTAPIDLQSRNMEAGHATSVALVPQTVSSFCKVVFNVVSNNLGEDIKTLTLTAPEGCRWGDGGSNVYTFHVEDGFTAGQTVTLEYEDESSYRTLSGKAVTATYDSEHVTISESLSMPDMTSGYSASVDLNVPYLLFEDFSGLESFSSNDAYSMSSSGSKSAAKFLDGWTGGRVGGSEGLCVRLACRRETSADYPARMDSAPLNGVIKSPVDLSVSFDYGADNQYGGIPIITDGNVGQTCRIGYVTSSDSFASGATSGTFESDNSFYVKEYTGSYTNTPNDFNVTIHSAPAGNLLRISWRTEIEHQAGLTNTTAWLYVDNVKVKVARNKE